MAKKHEELPQARTTKACFYRETLEGAHFQGGEARKFVVGRARTTTYRFLAIPARRE